MLLLSKFYNRKNTILIALILFFVYLFHPSMALAYIGPGAGFAVATSLFLALATIIVTLLGLLFWPIKFVVRKIKTRKWKKLTPYHLRKKKVIVLGYDGMDYTLLCQFMKEGHLPNLSKLAETGTFSRLISTSPPESPVAWASFLTGCNPGKHNIFDFLARDPNTYLPKLSIAQVHPPKWTIPVGKYNIPLFPGKVEGMRKGVPFWEILGERNISATVIRVPVTFPAEKFNGVVLASMGVPDMLGSQGTFTFFTTDGAKLAENEGGVIVKVEKNENEILTQLLGPRNSLLKTQPQTKINLTIKVNEKTNSAVVYLTEQKKSVNLKVREYSPWVEISFSLGIGIKAHGICKFYLKSISPEFEMYVTPINIHPEKTSMPISYPNFYSKYLSIAAGKFSTLGLAEDTWALNNGVIDEDAFLEQCYGYLDERENVFFHELRKFKRGCLVHVFDTTDRIQHMFWQFIDQDHPNHFHKNNEKYRDIILDVYKRMDKITEKILSQADDDTSVFILSDHGFKTFRYGMHVNTWLKQEGYLALKDGIEEDPKFFRGVDWTKTRAYAIGLSGIYINIAGRERYGIVKSGEEANTLVKEMSAKLLDFTDSEHDICPLYRADSKYNIYKGEYLNEAPDIVLGFKPGYRVSWKTTLGGTPAVTIIENNMHNWSGDHCLAPELVPGIFFSNKKLIKCTKRGVSILDLAPTILKEFGIDPPETMDGRSLI